MTLFGDLMKICIIGSSKRLSVLEENLKNKGILVQTIHSSDELPKYINDDIVILPIPTVHANGFVNLSGEIQLSVDSLLNRINSDSHIISCGYHNENYHMTDLNCREDFAYLNAVPTAEGAIYYALKHTERSLYESKILITGFGRVSKLLANRLNGLCANITIAARSSKDLAYASSLMFNVVNIKSLKNLIYQYDIIFQTVPSEILTAEIIDNMNRNNLIIELSSKSKGTDYAYAESKGIKVIHAPALPEKISPISAGNILTKSVLSIISEQKGSDYSE